MGLVVASHNDPWINFYKIPGYDRYVVWFYHHNACIEVTKYLCLVNYGKEMVVSKSVDPFKFDNFFEAEEHIKKIVKQFKDIQLELKMMKIRDRLQDLEKDFENE